MTRRVELTKKERAEARKEQDGDVYAELGWPPRMTNVSADGREMGARAAKVFRKALNQ